ncbi:nucleoside triphosphate hydrolase [Escherichia coli]|nr:nucleoside triphosphate hydrolase [Escherichia coli]
MKMFLTRIGFNSKAVITVDVTQNDLPRNTKSGLRHAIEVLADVEAVSFNFFPREEGVRSPVAAGVVTGWTLFPPPSPRIRGKVRMADLL